MFGLKIFVQTFGRVPPVLPCNFCHPVPAHPWCRFWAYHREIIRYSCVWPPCMNNLWQLLSDNVNLSPPPAFPNNGECCSRCCGQPRPVEELFASLWSLLLAGAHLTLLDIFYHSWWFSSSSSIPVQNIFLPQSRASGAHCIPGLPNISVWDRQHNEALCFDLSASQIVLKGTVPLKFRYCFFVSVKFFWFEIP